MNVQFIPGTFLWNLADQQYLNGTMTQQQWQTATAGGWTPPGPAPPGPNTGNGLKGGGGGGGLTYCLRCKKKTGGAMSMQQGMLKGNCSVCGCKKCKFVKKNTTRNDKEGGSILRKMLGSMNPKQRKTTRNITSGLEKTLAVMGAF